jgi:hypothetical protein
MRKPSKILLQTTIPATADDWSIARFELLRRHLAGLKDEEGGPVFSVTARDRAPLASPDPVLGELEGSDYDALWLFAVDSGDNLTDADCAGITAFRKRGGGMMVTRDHMDLGSSICTLGGVGAAHHFHSRNVNPDDAQHVIDDPYTTDISWPNFHSGANGDYQDISVAGPAHPVLHNVRYLPAHPHEGDVGAPPDDPSARVIATGKSIVTGRSFNLAVAFEASEANGPAIAQSTFHHFADYNWDPSRGCPSFVSEPPGHAIADTPAAQDSIRTYARNVALWLVGRPVE